MADIEALASKDVKSVFSWNLVLRTIYHLGYFIGDNGILVWCLGIGDRINRAASNNPAVATFKYMLPAFFTNWNFSFQTLFLGLSLLHDVLEWSGKHNGNFGSKVRYWRDVLFCGCVLPFTLFVSSMFWTVYAIDRELVFPKIYDEVVPWWFNHCVHTNILVVLALETLLQARRHPTDRKVEVTMYWGVAVAYAVVYYTIYFATGRWLYQVFGVMSWWQVCLYQLWIWLSSYIFYLLQFPINRLFHAEERPQISESNGETKTADGEEPKAENAKVITDLKTPPFSTRSWSVKFRSLRNHFETSRL
ncbi:unnamed protein product [Leptosia nina]|uniref:Androgen-dependent TFPI-regulating protein n=1 Tax=Leptosia nina TaxID=320188 RepID=A0AAV1JJN9_9NEOP